MGRKTANVVLGNAFDVPGITVDTHFGRLVRRFGLTEETDPVKVEHAIGALFPKRDWTMLSPPRDLARPAPLPRQAPACGACPIARWCPSYGEGPTDPVVAEALVTHPGPGVSRARARGAGRRRARCAPRSLAGCAPGSSALGRPGRARSPTSTVDTPQLRRMKASAGVEPCRPGAATDGALPAVSLPCLGGGEAVDLSTLRARW